jgi:hypothetical protein
MHLTKTIHLIRITTTCLCLTTRKFFCRVTVAFYQNLVTNDAFCTKIITRILTITSVVFYESCSR